MSKLGEIALRRLDLPSLNGRERSAVLTRSGSVRHIADCHTERMGGNVRWRHLAGPLALGSGKSNLPRSGQAIVRRVSRQAPSVTWKHPSAKVNFRVTNRRCVLRCARPPKRPSWSMPNLPSGGPEQVVKYLGRYTASLPRRQGQTPVGPGASLPTAYATREKRDIVPPTFIAKPNHPLRSRHFSDLRRPIGGAIILPLP